MTGITLCSIVAIFILGAPAYSQNAAQTPAAVTSKITIQKVTIQGNRALSTAQIKGAMKRIKEGTSSNVPIGKDTTDLKLQEDLVRIRMLYGEHGFARINILDPIFEVKKVEVGRTLENQYFITIKIEENDQYRISNVQITGNKQFTADEIRRTCGIATGQIYNETTLRKGFEKLKKMYANRGFINFVPAPAFDFDETKRVVGITIQIQEG